MLNKTSKRMISEDMGSPPHNTKNEGFQDIELQALRDLVKADKDHEGKGFGKDHVCVRP